MKNRCVKISLASINFWQKEISSEYFLREFNNNNNYIVMEYIDIGIISYYFQCVKKKRIMYYFFPILNVLIKKIYCTFFFMTSEPNRDFNKYNNLSDSQELQLFYHEINTFVIDSTNILYHIIQIIKQLNIL